MTKNPFQSVIDALGAARWQPENAREVMAWYDGLKEVNDAYASMLARHRSTLDDTFKQDSSASMQASEFAAQAQRMSSAAEEARSLFYRLHRDRISWLDESHQGADKWDISKNRQ